MSGLMGSGVRSSRFLKRNVTGSTMDLPGIFRAEKETDDDRVIAGFNGQCAVLIKRVMTTKEGKRTWELRGRIDWVSERSKNVVLDNCKWKKGSSIDGHVAVCIKDYGCVFLATPDQSSVRNVFWWKFDNNGVISEVDCLANMSMTCIGISGMEDYDDCCFLVSDGLEIFSVDMKNCAGDGTGANVERLYKCECDKRIVSFHACEDHLVVMQKGDEQTECVVFQRRPGERPIMRITDVAQDSSALCCENRVYIVNESTDDERRSHVRCFEIWSGRSHLLLDVLSCAVYMDGTHLVQIDRDEMFFTIEKERYMCKPEIKYLTTAGDRICIWYNKKEAPEILNYGMSDAFDSQSAQEALLQAVATKIDEYVVEEHAKTDKCAMDVRAIDGIMHEWSTKADVLTSTMVERESRSGDQGVVLAGAVCVDHVTREYQCDRQFRWSFRLPDDEFMEFCEAHVKPNVLARITEENLALGKGHTGRVTRATLIDLAEKLADLIVCGHNLSNLKRYLKYVSAALEVNGVIDPFLRDVLSRRGLFRLY